MRLLLGLLLAGWAVARPGMTRPVVVLRSGGRCVAGQVIVTLDKRTALRIRPAAAAGLLCVGVSDLDELLRAWGASGFDRIWRGPNPGPAATDIGVDRQYLLTFGTGVDVEAAVAAFGRCPGIEYACPNAVLPLDGVTDDIPDDSLYPEQWHLPHIGAPRAWDYAHGDSNVVVAVLDDGVVWRHPDIAPNLWVNRSEDINGNGRFDPEPPPDGDLDGIDQDGNGYMDDVVGWDFHHGDPDPNAEGGDDHGTRCWGIANAATDNCIGIAAPPWNVRSMGLRCGAGGGISLYGAISAIYYGIPLGVDVFSMSFGGTTPYQPMAAACLYAWQSGALLCASVGTSGNEEPRYPACYDGVLAVASSGRTDLKSPFSGYGTWVDITAPGESILTTSGDSGYVFMTGTSAATPVVAGVLAWLRSAFPDHSRDSIQQLLFDWADSMPDPLYLQGKLGHGRVSMDDSINVAVLDQLVLAGQRAGATLVHARLQRRGSEPAVLVDAGGRRVLELVPGSNDLRAVRAGVYYVVTERGRPGGRVVRVH